MKKYDLGCYPKPMPGFLGIDKAKSDDPNMFQYDFEKGLPRFIKENSVDYIRANHLVEHIKEPANLLNDCWKVLKKSGVFEIIVPYGLWEGASKPVHYQSITECWFDFLRDEKNYYIYGYRPWDILKLTCQRDRGGKIFQINCKLTPKK